MAGTDPIESLVVTIEGDFRKLLKDVKEGVVLAEDELTQISLEPGELLQQVRTTTKTIGSRFTTMLSNIGQFARNTFSRFSGYLQNLQGGYQRVDQAASALTANQERMNRLLAEGQQQGATLVQELTALVIRLSEASGEPFQNIIDGMVQAKQATKDQGDAIAKTLGIAGGASEKFAGVLGSLGSVINSTFGVAMGISAVQMIRKFVNEVRTAVKDTIELQTSVVRLQVSVRAAQRSSGEMVGSIAAWQQSLEELGDTYRQLSQVEIQAAGARVILLTRQMRFNQDQIQRTIESAAQLASLYQIDMNRAISLVTQGLTGVARGLRQYGVQLSKAVLLEEARAQGINKSWNEMDAAERGLVALNVIEKQLAGTSEDLDIIYGTLGGRLQAAAADARDAKAQIGSLTAFLKVMGAEIQAKVLVGLADLILTFEKLFTMAAAGGALIGTFYSNLRAGVGVQESMRLGLEAYNETLYRTAAAFGLIGESLEDVEAGGDIWANLISDLNVASDEALSELQELAEDYGAKFAELQIDLENKIAESWRKLKDKLVELGIELAEKQAEAWRKRLDAIAELEIKYGEKIEDIEIKTQEKLENLTSQLSEKRAEILAALYKKLRRLQEDYQIASRRSRERFIEDLQDAVANRDAFAAVQLIKKQRREQRELLEDYEVKRRRAIEDAQERLAGLKEDLEAQRQEILRWRERELAAAARWKERRLGDIDRDYGSQMAKLQRWHENKHRELIQDQKEEEAELKRHCRARQLELARALAEEENITEEGARAIFEQLDKVFGLGGMIEQMMAAFRERLATRIEIETRVNQINVGGGLPATTPWLPTVPLQPYQDTTPTPGPTASPDVAPVSTVANVNRTNTIQSLGILQIQVSADEHFSEDFEARVEEQIAGFVGNVLIRPRRGF